MGMQFSTGIDFKWKDEFDFSSALEMPGECSFSVGQSVETSTRYSYDFTRTSQSLVRCRRPRAKTYSISYTYTRAEVADLWDALVQAEDAVGKVGMLHYGGIAHGLVIIASMSSALSIDCADGLAGLQISFEMQEAKEPTKPAPRLKLDTYRGQNA